MQKVRVANVSVKHGSNDKGPWVNTRVTGEDGAVFGTFHKGAQYIKKGDLIELEPIVKGRNINFEEWRMVEEAPASEKPAPVDGGDSPEKVQIAETQKAAELAITAFTSLHDKLTEDALKVKLRDAFEHALDWCNARLTGSVPPAASPAHRSTPPAATREAIASGEFRDVGQLLQALTDKFPHLNRDKILAELNVNEPKEITNLKEAWDTICSIYEKAVSEEWENLGRREGE